MEDRSQESLDILWKSPPSEQLALIEGAVIDLWEAQIRSTNEAGMRPLGSPLPE